MKKINLPILLLILLTGISCSNSNTQEQTAVSPKCYQAINDADTAYLMFAPVKGKIEGKLSFNFSKKQDLDGSIKGEFVDDTLFVDYNYRYNGAMVQNPQAFLVSDDKLLQGSGELVFYLGRTYLKKPIDFQKGFIFEPITCK